MALQKSTAVVLKTRDQGETSKLVTLYTQEFGKMTVIAKGARSTKSRFMGVLDTLNIIRIVIYLKKNRDLQFLSQAELVNSLPNLHSQLGKLALAAILCEMVEKTESSGHVNSRLFSLLETTLQELDKNDTGLRNIIRSFQIKFAELAGFFPNFEECIECGEIHQTGDVFFQLDQGGFTCQNCGKMDHQSINLTSTTLDVLKWLNLMSITKAHEANVNASCGQEIDHFIMTYLRYHIEELDHLKSIKYLTELQNNLTNIK